MRRRARTALVALVSGLACNGGLDPVATPTACPPGQVEICGTITFRGTVPDSTQAVYVVAYHTFPRSRDSLFNFQPSLLQLQRLPLDRASAFYAIPVTTGRYEWVVAVWVKQGFTLANADTTLRETGYYRDPADSTQPGVVTVTAQGADSIDFVVDFAQMRAPCSYYAPPCP
jgi:hypothetical protein